MKKFKKSWFLLVSFMLCIFLFSACDEDNNKEEEQDEIYGEWHFSSVKTDNQALNGALDLLIIQQGIDIKASFVTFGTDGNAVINISSTQSPIREVLEYAYKDKQLAFLFGDLVPLNAFNVSTLTNSRLTLENTFSPEVLKLIIQLVKVENQEIGVILESVLASSMTNGLSITIQLTK